MHTEMQLQVGDNFYRVEKSHKFFGYYQFFRVLSVERNLLEYMGSCTFNSLSVELGKIVWGTK